MQRKKNKISRRKFLKDTTIATGTMATGRLPAAFASGKKPSGKQPQTSAYKGRYKSDWKKLFECYPDWQNSVKGKRCVKLTDRAADYSWVSPEYVIDYVKRARVSESTYAKIGKDLKSVNRAQSNIKDYSTESGRKRYQQLETRKKELLKQSSIMRTLLDANLVRSTFSDLPAHELPPSGTELSSAVMERSTTARISRPAAGSEGKSIFDSIRDWLGSKQEPSQPVERHQRIQRDVAKLSPGSTLRQPMPETTNSRWLDVFKTYPGLRQGLNQPRYARNAKAAITLVDRVATSTGATPMDVIAVRRKYAISNYALPKYKNITRAERKIFDALLKEQKSNKQAFDYMVRATRSWFANN